MSCPPSMASLHSPGYDKQGHRGAQRSGSHAAGPSSALHRVVQGFHMVQFAKDRRTYIDTGAEVGGDFFSPVGFLGLYIVKITMHDRRQDRMKSNRKATR